MLAEGGTWQSFCAHVEIKRGWTSGLMKEVMRSLTLADGTCPVGNLHSNILVVGPAIDRFADVVIFFGFALGTAGMSAEKPHSF